MAADQPTAVVTERFRSIYMSLALCWARMLQQAASQVASAFAAGLLRPPL